jgi:hypothetical protein
VWTLANQTSKNSAETAEVAPSALPCLALPRCHQRSPALAALADRDACAAVRGRGRRGEEGDTQTVQRRGSGAGAGGFAGQCRSVTSVHSTLALAALTALLAPALSRGGRGQAMMAVGCMAKALLGRGKRGEARGADACHAAQGVNLAQRHGRETERQPYAAPLGRRLRGSNGPGDQDAQVRQRLRASRRCARLRWQCPCRQRPWRFPRPPAPAPGHPPPGADTATKSASKICW